jgi:hypothetical protein
VEIAVMMMDTAPAGDMVQTQAMADQGKSMSFDDLFYF